MSVPMMSGLDTEVAVLLGERDRSCPRIGCRIDRSSTGCASRVPTDGYSNRSGSNATLALSNVASTSISRHTANARAPTAVCSTVISLSEPRRGARRRRTRRERRRRPRARHDHPRHDRVPGPPPIPHHRAWITTRCRSRASQPRVRWTVRRLADRGVLPHRTVTGDRTRGREQLPVRILRRRDEPTLPGASQRQRLARPARVRRRRRRSRVSQRTPRPQCAAWIVRGAVRNQPRHRARHLSRRRMPGPHLRSQRRRPPLLDGRQTRTRRVRAADDPQYAALRTRLADPHQASRRGPLRHRTRRTLVSTPSQRDRRTGSKHAPRTPSRTCAPQRRPLRQHLGREHTAPP